MDTQANVSETTTVTVNVSKESYELGEAIAKLAADVKKQLADGLQPIPDAIAIGSDIVSDLLPGFQGVEKIKDEMKDPAVFALTCAMVGAKVIGALIG